MGQLPGHGLRAKEHSVAGALDPFQEPTGLAVVRGLEACQAQRHKRRRAAGRLSEFDFQGAIGEFQNKGVLCHGVFKLKCSGWLCLL